MHREVRNTRSMEHTQQWLLLLGQEIMRMRIKKGSLMVTGDAAVRKGDGDRGMSWEPPWKPSLSMAHLE